MKLIAIYNVWGDSMELLKGSIEQIRHSVDFVLIVAQEESNLGEIDKTVYPFCENLVTNNLVDEIIKFEPSGINPYRNELAKRQIGLEFAKQNGFSHFLHLDCDEYYLPHEFNTAKEQIEKENILATVIDLYTYYKDPTYRLLNKESYGVPFITKLFPHTRVEVKNRGNYPVSVDPTRAVNVLHPKRLTGVNMHHFSYIREDIKKKLRNSTANRNINNHRVVTEYENAKIGTHLKALFNDKLVGVENIFKIKINVKEQV